MISSEEVVDRDLEYVCESLGEELGALSGKRLLVTGGAGFLGYYLIKSAMHWNRTNRDKGPISLAVYDNFVRGRPAWLVDLAAEDSLSLVEHDMTDPLPADIGDYHYIIHAASIASPTYYRKHPIETMDANVIGLRSLLDYSRSQRLKDDPVEGFLFFSSSEIYGDPAPEDIPTPETYLGSVSCTGPRACYDESKRYGETLCVNFARQYELPVRVARPFNNYGPGLKITDRRVIPDFARDLMEGRDIVMLSDGSPRRTFCYVTDAVIGYYKILLRGRDGEAYNIGVETPEITMSALAERVARLGSELFGYEGRVIHQTSPEEDYLVNNPSRRCPRIEKARAELGYDPGISLDDGLRRSLIWYDAHRQAEES